MKIIDLIELDKKSKHENLRKLIKNPPSTFFTKCHSKMGASSSKEFSVSGTVAPGYGSVKKVFEEMFETGSEENSQVCVYVGQDKVVDLWGTVHKDGNFNANSLINVYWTSKCLTSVMMAMAKDKGSR